MPRELRALLAPEGQQQCRKWHHQLIAERLPAGDMKAMDEALLLEAARRLDLGVGELGARVQQHHVLDVFDAFGMAEERARPMCKAIAQPGERGLTALNRRRGGDGHDAR